MSDHETISKLADQGMPTRMIAIHMLRKWCGEAEAEFNQVDESCKGLSRAMRRMEDRNSQTWWAASLKLGQLNEKRRLLKADLDALEDELYRKLHDEQASKTLCVGAVGGGA